MIDLYGMSSPNVRKIQIMLEELDAPYRFLPVDVFRGAQFQPEFTSKSPFYKVPLLVDHDVEGEAQTIFESGAILFYLAEKHGRFLPKAGPARQAVINWLMAQVAQIGPMFGQLMHFKVVTKKAHDYPTARYKTQAETLFRVLDRRLADARYLAGDAYSIADIATWPWAEYIDVFGFDAAALPAFSRWREEVRARPAVARASAKFAEVRQADMANSKAATPEERDRFFWRTPPG